MSRVPIVGSDGARKAGTGAARQQGRERPDHRGYTDKKAGDDWARAYELSKQIGAEGALVPALGGLWSFYFVRGPHTFAST